ncbi:DUF7553 family protein [Natronococcus zhouii]
MNNHFKDSRYHLARAAEHAKWGVMTEVERSKARVRTMAGPEPEPNRLQRVRAAVAAREQVATARARRAVGEVRKVVSGSRDRSSEREQST